MYIVKEKENGPSRSRRRRAHTMQNQVVSREVWLEARRALLLKEKEATHLRDKVNAARTALPWVKV